MKSKQQNTDQRAEELANKWIKELSGAGFSPDDMILIFRQARRRIEEYKGRKLKRSNNGHY